MNQNYMYLTPESHLLNGNLVRSPYSSACNCLHSSSTFQQNSPSIHPIYYPLYSYLKDNTTSYNVLPTKPALTIESFSQTDITVDCLSNNSIKSPQDTYSLSTINLRPSVNSILRRSNIILRSWAPVKIDKRGLCCIAGFDIDSEEKVVTQTIFAIGCEGNIVFDGYASYQLSGPVVWKTLTNMIPELGEYRFPKKYTKAFENGFPIRKWKKWIKDIYHIISNNSLPNVSKAYSVECQASSFDYDPDGSISPVDAYLETVGLFNQSDKENGNYQMSTSHSESSISHSKNKWSSQENSVDESDHDRPSLKRKRILCDEPNYRHNHTRYHISPTACVDTQKKLHLFNSRNKRYHKISDKADGATRQQQTSDSRKKFIPKRDSYLDSDSSSELSSKSPAKEKIRSEDSDSTDEYPQRTWPLHKSRGKPVKINDCPPNSSSHDYHISRNNNLPNKYMNRKKVVRHQILNNESPKLSCKKTNENYYSSRNNTNLPIDSHPHPDLYKDSKSKGKTQHKSYPKSKSKVRDHLSNNDCVDLDDIGEDYVETLPRCAVKESTKGHEKRCKIPTNPHKVHEPPYISPEIHKLLNHRSLRIKKKSIPSKTTPQIGLEDCFKLVLHTGETVDVRQLPRTRSGRLSIPIRDRWHKQKIVCFGENIGVKHGEYGKIYSSFMDE